MTWDLVFYYRINPLMTPTLCFKGQTRSEGGETGESISKYLLPKFVDGSFVYLHFCFLSIQINVC